MSATIIIGEADKGFTVNGKKIAFEDLLSYIDVNTLKAPADQLADEYEQAYRMINSGKYPQNPIISGFHDAIIQYQMWQLFTQISNLENNIRIMYADQEDYGNLNNSLARNLGIISDEMLDENKHLINAFKGMVIISASKLESNDTNNTAFTLRFDNIPQEVCLEISASGLIGSENSELIAFGINQDLSDAFRDVCKTNNGILCNNKKISMQKILQEAQKHCQENNALFFKFQ